MIGPVRSYKDIYVADCGSTFPNRTEGLAHEASCPACGAARWKSQSEDVPQLASPCCGAPIDFERCETIAHPDRPPYDVYFDWCTKCEKPIQWRAAQGVS